MENLKLLKLIYKKLCEISNQLYSFEDNFLDTDEVIRDIRELNDNYNYIPEDFVEKDK